MHDLTEGLENEEDPSRLRESARIAPEVEVPAEIEERLRREREDEEAEADVDG